jgi:serine/threonine-protein kinase ATR
LAASLTTRRIIVAALGKLIALVSAVSLRRCVAQGGIVTIIIVFAIVTIAATVASVASAAIFAAISFVILALAILLALALALALALTLTLTLTLTLALTLALACFCVLCPLVLFPVLGMLRVLPRFRHFARILVIRLRV